jgi:hypothetical protein
VRDENSAAVYSIEKLLMNIWLSLPVRVFPFEYIHGHRHHPAKWIDRAAAVAVVAFFLRAGSQTR